MKTDYQYKISCYIYQSSQDQTIRTGVKQIKKLLGKIDNWQMIKNEMNEVYYVKRVTSKNIRIQNTASIWLSMSLSLSTYN